MIEIISVLENHLHMGISHQAATTSNYILKQQQHNNNFINPPRRKRDLFFFVYDYYLFCCYCIVFICELYDQPAVIQQTNRRDLELTITNSLYNSFLLLLFLLLLLRYNTNIIHSAKRHCGEVMLHINVCTCVFDYNIYYKNLLYRIRSKYRIKIIK